mgnify:FL=1
MKHLIQRSLIASTFIITSLFASQAMAAPVVIDSANVHWIKLRGAGDDVDTVKLKTGYTGTIPADCTVTISQGAVFTLPSKILSATVPQATVNYAQTAYVTLLSALNNNRKVWLLVEKRPSDGYCEIKEVATYGD